MNEGVPIVIELPERERELEVRIASRVRNAKTTLELRNRPFEIAGARERNAADEPRVVVVR